MRIRLLWQWSQAEHRLLSAPAFLYGFQVFSVDGKIFIEKYGFTINSYFPIERRLATKLLIEQVDDGRLDASEVIRRAKDMIDDVALCTVKNWKKENPLGKAVGCFPVYTPHEIVHASGMLPVGLVGGGDRIQIDRADAILQSFVCSICRSTLELGLTGKLDCLDAYIFPYICDSNRNLSGIFQRNFPQKPSVLLQLVQNAESRGALQYLTHEYRRLARVLEKLGGSRIDDEALRRSIHIYNENRRLLRELYQCRKITPWLISAAESYTLTRMGTLMPKEEHSTLLRQVLNGLARRNTKARDNVRVVLEGCFCEQPPLDLIQTFEDAGCYVVDDDLLLGERWFHQDIEVDGDPFSALAVAYLQDSVTSSIKYCSPPRSRSIIEKVRNAQAEAVILCTPKFCEPALDDYVLYKEALEKHGIPYLVVEFEEKMTAFEAARSQLETFVESILFD